MLKSTAGAEWETLKEFRRQSSRSTDAATQSSSPCLRWQCSFSSRIAHYLPNCFFAASTIRSGSNPNFFCNSFSGAEAPNDFMPIT